MPFPVTDSIVLSCNIYCCNAPSVRTLVAVWHFWHASAVPECSGSVGRVLDWGSKCCLFQSHHWGSHCVVSLSMTLYPLLSTFSTQEDLMKQLKNCWLGCKESKQTSADQSQRVSIEDPSIGGQRWHTSPKCGNQWQLPQLLQLLIARPSFFPWSTASKPWPCRIWVLEICITSDLLGLECISPSLFPSLELMEPQVHSLGIFFADDCQILSNISSK